MIRVSDGRERRLGLSRRRLLYGVAATGAAASSGSGVAALLADDERTGARFTGGTLDLSVDVQSPESWDNGPYDAAIAPNGSQEAEFDLSVDDNPAYVWLVAPCPTCEKYENRVNVTLELTDRSDGFEYELFDDSLRSFRQAYSSGRPLSESALRPGETWTVSFTWDLTGSVPDDVDFDFEFRAVQERHIDDPESHALDVDHAPCDGCDEGDGGGESECGKDVSFVAFCSEGDGMAKIEPGDVEFERKRCGDTDRHATLNVEALPAHATHVLLKSATGLDVFEYDGEGTPFTVTSGGANAALELDGSYEQDGNVFVGSGDPPRKTGDPCPGGYWYKYDFDGGEESFGAPGDDIGGDNDDT